MFSTALDTRRFPEHQMFDQSDDNPKRFDRQRNENSTRYGTARTLVASRSSPTSADGELCLKTIFAPIYPFSGLWYYCKKTCELEQSLSSCLDLSTNLSFTYAAVATQLEQGSARRWWESLWQSVPIGALYACHTLLRNKIFLQ